MNTQTSTSKTDYTLGTRIGGVFAGTILTGLFVGGPAAMGALIGGGIGWGAAVAEVVTHLDSYNTIPEAVAAANFWTTAASEIVGAVGGIIGAVKALEHPWARGAVRMMLFMKPAAE